MQDETIEKQQEITEAIEELGLEVTRFELTEYIPGDPTRGGILYRRERKLK